MTSARTSRVLARSCFLLMWLTLAMSSCMDPTTVMQPAPISVHPNAETLVADGFSNVLLSAELPRSVPQDALVDFSTSIGRLITPAGVPDRKVTVRARDGRAEVRLISPGEVGTAYVTATGAGSMAQATVELTPALPDIIDLFVDRTAAPADGATAITATAVLRRIAGTVSRGIPVRFEAKDSATQVPLPALSGVIVADSGGAARLKLVTTIPSTIQVRAYVGTLVSEPRVVSFTPLPAAVRMIKE
jgi:hypothetical protein